MDSGIQEDEDEIIRNWVIERIGADASILGPGQLEIRLRRFDARKVQRLEGSAEELGLELEEGEEFFTQKVFRIWGHRLSEDTLLRLYSISDAARPSQRAAHYLDLLHPEWSVEWHPVPEYFAEELHALGAETRSPASDGESSEEQSGMKPA